MKGLFATFILTLFVSSAIAENNGTKACNGDIGMVQNMMIQVTDTEIEITFDPPSGYEDCKMEYKVVFWNGANLLKYQETKTTNLQASFNYWEERVLCKLVNIDVTPIYEGIDGEVYQSNQFTDKFDAHIDIGPVRNLRLEITDVLQLRWWSPEDYDDCLMVFNIQMVDVTESVFIVNDTHQGFEYKYDYAADNNYCKYVIAKVESTYRGVSGGGVFKSIRLGASSGSCE